MSKAMTRFAVALVCAGCSGAEHLPSTGATLEGGVDTNLPAGGSAGSTGAPTADAGAPEASVALGPVRFQIRFDYRFDKAGFFTDPTRRATLEGAARIWGRLLSDSFPYVPAGMFVFIKDPENPYGSGTSFTLEYAIDDLVVFVGSAKLDGTQVALSGPSAGLSGVADPTLIHALDARYTGTPFQPWTGSMSFDTATDFYFDPTPDAPHTPAADKIDFLSIAVHELGHVLGFGTSDAFKAKIAASGAFTGMDADALYGGPVPLSSDRRHVPDTLTFGGTRPLMNVSFPPGKRYAPTPLDKAFLADIGYHF